MTLKKKTPSYVYFKPANKTTSNVPIRTNSLLLAFASSSFRFLSNDGLQVLSKSKERGKRHSLGFIAWTALSRRGGRPVRNGEDFLKAAAMASEDSERDMWVAAGAACVVVVVEVILRVRCIFWK